MQSKCNHAPGLHLAVIMDGNGRWARKRGWPRTAGHRRGADGVRMLIEHAPRHGIAMLTVFAFSADNWKRPSDEVATLMGLFGTYLRREVAELARQGVRLSVIGRRDRLAAPLRSAIGAAETATAAGRRLHLRLAVDYSARASLADAAARGVALADATVPAVDVLIRTGGEKRLSDFLLWECAYAELVFSDVLWPDFSSDHLAVAMAEFQRRERRFGGLVAPAAAR
jgi:undecaprenyl diphosphate synthase